MHLALLSIRKIKQDAALGAAGPIFRVEVAMGDTGLPPYEPVVGVDFITRDSICDLLDVLRAAISDSPAVYLDACGRPAWPGVESGAPNPYARSGVTPPENLSKAGSTEPAAFGGGGNAEPARPQPQSPATSASIPLSVPKETLDCWDRLLARLDDGEIKS